MKVYLVGGAVRDNIMGRPSSDLDYTVVMSPDEGGSDPFEMMCRMIKNRGGEIFKVKEQYLTVRARFGKDTGDFVLARKEGVYTDGRRPDKVTLGSLSDDLARRDFTVNAIAQDIHTGEIIDPHGGCRDIERGLLRAVDNPVEKLREDALRAVRALRFSVTHNMHIEPLLREAMLRPDVLNALRFNISDERIEKELGKMFAFDTVLSLLVLSQFPALMEEIFAGSVWLQPSMKKRLNRTQHKGVKNDND